MTNNDIDYIIRPSHEGDAPLVLSSWRRSNKRNNPVLNRFCTHPIYNEWFRDYQMDLLMKGAQCLVACSESDLNQLLGYVCFHNQKPPIVHFVYTKSVYRQLGIATALLRAVGLTKKDPILCSTITNACNKSDYHIVYLPSLEDYLLEQ